jgi:hypothetical protein
LGVIVLSILDPHNSRCQPKHGPLASFARKALFLLMVEKKKIPPTWGSTNTELTIYSPQTPMLQIDASNKESTSTIAYILLNVTHHNFKLRSVSTAANTDIEQLTANNNAPAVENVPMRIQPKTVSKSIPAHVYAATAAATTKIGTTNAQHGTPSSTGLTTCGGNSHLILPRKIRTPDHGALLWSIRPYKAARGIGGTRMER